MKPTRSLLHSVLQLLRSWYAVDRVRVSSSSGRLLSLRVDERILIRGNIFTVVNRQTIASREGIRLVYQLTSDDGGARLSVEPDSSGTTHVSELTTNNSTTTIYEDDIVELGGSVETAGNPHCHD
ncbi:MAG TPA: hypothetical protein EYG03_28195 [Planctomycetes bacterium]|nr:hypothetical protein [Fuerstiella sp.]HIK95846.1 hypothetical protein [Planctomycetota bacterium]